MNLSFTRFIKKKLFSMRAEGGSMLPILYPKDLIFFKKTSFQQCRTNDIIIFKKQSQFLTHRVIYKSKSHLITKGDNNQQSDGKIPPKQIIGKAYQIKRNKIIINPDNIYLMQSTLYFGEIIKIKRLFNGAHIDFVLLKGLPLHLYYEKTHPKRTYADCDVLVNKNDFQKAEKILLKQGYKKQDTSLSKGQKNMKDKESELAYFKIINGFIVMFDLHLEVVFMMTQLGKLDAVYPQKLIDKLTEECLKTKRQIKINNKSFQILDTRYLILYLSLHFFHHNYRGAFRLDFLDKIIRKSKLNSDLTNQLTNKVKNYRLENFIYPTFILLKKYYKTPIPQSFLKSIKPRNPLTLKLVNLLINTSIFDDEPRIRAGINRFKNIFFLSPYPLWKKLFIFINLQVVYSILWITSRRVLFYFKRRILYS